MSPQNLANRLASALISRLNDDLSLIDDDLPLGELNDGIVNGVDDILQLAGVNEEIRTVADIGMEVVLVVVEVAFLLTRSLSRSRPWIQRREMMTRS